MDHKSLCFAQIFVQAWMSLTVHTSSKRLLNWCRYEHTEFMVFAPRVGAASLCFCSITGLRLPPQFCMTTNSRTLTSSRRTSSS